MQGIRQCAKLTDPAPGMWNRRTPATPVRSGRWARSGQGQSGFAALHPRKWNQLLPLPGWTRSRRQLSVRKLPFGILGQQLTIALGTWKRPSTLRRRRPHSWTERVEYLLPRSHSLSFSGAFFTLEDEEKKKLKALVAVLSSDWKIRVTSFKVSWSLIQKSERPLKWKGNVIKICKNIG